MSLMNKDKDPFPSNKDKAAVFLEQWKKLIDLHIFHDNLRQQRIQRFVTINFASAAGFSYAMHTFQQNRIVLYSILSISIAIFMMINSFFALAQQARAGDYIMTIKNQLRNVEKAIVTINRINALMPYISQYKILNERIISFDNEANYIDKRPILKSNAAASDIERNILKCVLGGWVVALIVSFAYTYLFFRYGVIQLGI